MGDLRTEDRNIGRPLCGRAALEGRTCSASRTMLTARWGGSAAGDETL